MAVLGDSLSEGVQSADANRLTQPLGYASLIALQMHASFPLPLIDVSPVGVVGSTFSRHRLHPAVVAADLAVSSARVSDVLSASSSSGGEYGLVLSPRTTTEIGAVESNPAPLIIYWAGSDDVISAVLDFDKLDGSQITPIQTFRTNFGETVEILKGLHRRVVIGNVPDLTRIAFVMDRTALQQFAGSDFGLPDGSYTTLITALLLRLGLEKSSLLKNADYVLDASEIAHIRRSVSEINASIASLAGAAGFPVVDVFTYFERLMANPPSYGGVTLSNGYLGGLFSLDGIHPSNISYAMLANEFIRTINHGHLISHAVPELNQAQLNRIARHDPFVDRKDDGRVRGRFGAGLLETLAPFLGITHDRRVQAGRSGGERFIQEYRRRMEQNIESAIPASRSEIHSAMRHVFGLDALRAH